MHYLTSRRNFREHSMQAEAMVLSAGCNQFTLRFRVRNHSIKFEILSFSKKKGTCLKLCTKTVLLLSG